VEIAFAERRLCLSRRSKRLPGTLKGGEECIAFSAHHHAAVRCNGIAHQSAVFDERCPIALGTKLLK
jgi:hypothetical protein